MMVREMLVISGDPGRAKKGDLAFRMLLPWLIYLIQGKLPYPILDITLNRDISMNEPNDQELRLSDNVFSSQRP